MRTQSLLTSKWWLVTPQGYGRGHRQCTKCTAGAGTDGLFCYNAFPRRLDEPSDRLRLRDVDRISTKQSLPYLRGAVIKRTPPCERSSRPGRVRCGSRCGPGSHAGTRVYARSMQAVARPVPRRQRQRQISRAAFSQPRQSCGPGSALQPVHSRSAYVSRRLLQSSWRRTASRP